MERFPHMVDMSISADQSESSSPIVGAVSDKPRYPYGLGICLTQDELEKLGVDYSDWAVGDHFHLQAMAKITSISENETEGGKNCRVEMQIVALAGEDEDEEAEEY
jgi:hypothetical protein